MLLLVPLTAQQQQQQQQPGLQLRTDMACPHTNRRQDHFSRRNSSSSSRRASVVLGLCWIHSRDYWGCHCTACAHSSNTLGSSSSKSYTQSSSSSSRVVLVLQILLPLVPGWRTLYRMRYCSQVWQLLLCWIGCKCSLQQQQQDVGMLLGPKG
jgi:hypothetical protein